MPLRFIFVLLLFCFLFCLKVNAKSNFDQTVQPAVAQAPAAALQSFPPVSSTVNPITQAAVQGGVLACASRINQVSKFLTANTQSGAFLSVDPNGPDQHIFSASLEIIPSDTPSLYASSSFTPTPNGGCDAVYDTVQFMPGTCEEVARNHFKVNGTLGVLKKNIFMLNAGSVKVFLMSADRGCVVIKKEIVQ